MPNPRCLQRPAVTSGCEQKATKTTLKTAYKKRFSKAAARLPPTSYSDSSCSVWQSAFIKYNNNNNNGYQSHQLSTIRPIASRLIIMTIAVMQLMSTTALPLNAPAAGIQAQRTTLESMENAVNSTSHLSHAAGDRLSLWQRRKHKRNSNYLYFNHHMQESATHLEWQNPCGGVFEATEQDYSGYDGMPRLPARPPVRQYLRLLRQITRSEFRTLQEMPQTIDISNMEMWKLHRSHYKFLPKLRRNSSIALKRWYGNMQTFVASFAYLGRTQYKWDRSKTLHASKITHELNELLLSARRILCEIETTINGSYPHSSAQKLTTISREEMNRRLKFRTRRIETAYGLAEADAIDLRFVKHYYYDYLSTMWKVLRRQSKRPGQMLLHSGSVENTSAHSALVNSDENMNLSLNSILHETDEDKASASIEMLVPKKHANAHRRQHKRK